MARWMHFVSALALAIAGCAESTPRGATANSGRPASAVSRPSAYTVNRKIALPPAPGFGTALWVDVAGPAKDVVVIIQRLSQETDQEEDGADYSKIVGDRLTVGAVEVKLIMVKHGSPKPGSQWALRLKNPETGEIVWEELFTISPTMIMVALSR